MKVVYIAGPFRADNSWLVEQNIRRAEECALVLWKMGFAVVCPHTSTRFFDGTMDTERFIEGDLEILRRCDALILLIGYEGSRGSMREFDEAGGCGLPIFYWPGDIIKLKEWRLKVRDVR